MTTASTGEKRKVRKSAGLWITLVLAALPIAYFFYRRYIIQHIGLDNFFVLLEQRGYTPNVGFSGVFRPGNVIQVAEEGPNAQERTLVTPLVVAWADQCFPGQTPRTLEFTLPQFQGESSADLLLEGNMLSRMLPALELDNKAVANYSLALENTHIQSFAKGDLSAQFSAPCVAALKTAITGGDKVEWLRVVLEAIVADALTLQVNWNETASMESREQVANKASKALSQSLAAGSGGKEPELKVAVKTSDTQRTIVSARGVVIVGYRARPLQPVHAP